MCSPNVMLAENVGCARCRNSSSSRELSSNRMQFGGTAIVMLPPLLSTGTAVVFGTSPVFITLIFAYSLMSEPITPADGGESALFRVVAQWPRRR
jgi:hypothetical protein